MSSVSGVFVPLTLIALVALGFGGWPAIASRSVQQSGWVFINLSGVTVILLLLWYSQVAPGLLGQSLAPYPVGQDLFWQYAAGVANTVATIAYGYLLSTPQFRPFAPAALVFMIGVLAFGNALVDGQKLREILTDRNLVGGVTFGGIAVWFFSRASTGS